MRVLTLYLGLLLGFILVLAIVGCASAGFFQMSSDWCHQHLQASANRCPGR